MKLIAAVLLASALSTPAFADTPESTEGVSASDAFGVEDPASTDTPTDRLGPV